jgi:colanic acid/amylovoran biosynthesis glycosyltransferase
MRVAYLTGRYPAISHTFILREVEALRQLGVEVETFSVWRTQESELLAAADREAWASTMALLPLHPRLLAAVAVAARHSSALAAATREAVALSQPGWRGRMLAVSWVLEAVLVWHACRRGRIRHVHAHLGGTAPAVALLVAALGTAVDGEGAWTWSFTVHGPAELYDVVRERLAVKVRRATFVVAISDFARSQLLALVDEDQWDKVHVVHCGVDPAVFAPSATSEAQRDAAMRILCIGRLTRIKGQAVLLEAVRQLRERGVMLQATFVGDGPKRLDYERLARELGIEDCVTFTGAVGQDAILAEFAVADVFCISSFAEGVPVVLMEAMAMGKPVVASRIMGIAELVEDTVSGRLVAPARPDLLAEALERLAGDAALRERMGMAGRRKVLAEFDVTREAARLAELLSRYAATI